MLINWAPGATLGSNICSPPTMDILDSGSFKECSWKSHYVLAWFQVFRTLHVITHLTVVATPWSIY